MTGPPSPATPRGRSGDRLVLAVAVAGTVFIALGAFWLSFTSLTALARECGLPADRAWVWPLIVDGVIVVATVSVVAMTDSGRGRQATRYPWLLLLAGACVSMLANASHAIVTAQAGAPSVLAALVAAVPPVVLVAITHLTVELTRRPEPPPTPPPAAASRARVRARAQPGAAGRAGKESRDEAGAMAEARRLRASTSLTNREIAARVGVHPSTVGRWFKSHPPLALPAPTAAAEPSDTSEQRSPDEY